MAKIDVWRHEKLNRVLSKMQVLADVKLARYGNEEYGHTCIFLVLRDMSIG